MEKIDLIELKNQITKDLNNSVVSGRLLLDSLKVIDDSSRKTGAYLDHKYAPFYYYLSKYIQPEHFLEIGFDLGLLSSSFLYKNKSVKSFIGYKEYDKTYQSFRIGKSNIRTKFKKETNYFNCDLYDNDFQSFIRDKKLDFVLINEEKGYDKILEYLDFFWDQISENGLLLVEYLNKNKGSLEAFKSFSENKNRETIIIPTRYNVGIIQK